jgi:predicted metalloenzyme YecM
MIQSVEEFYTQSEKWVELFNTFCKKYNLKDNALPDHICYKCGSKESFNNLKNIFEFESEYIYQSIISKRSIAYIKFKKPIQTEIGEIYFLELSDQKPDGSQTDGFDHIEVYSTKISYDEFVKEFEKTEKVIAVVRPHHSTHDINIGQGFLFRCTEGKLIDKIKSTEMI